jgi:hypothetical protein
VRGRVIHNGELSPLIDEVLCGILNSTFEQILGNRSAWTHPVGRVPRYVQGSLDFLHCIEADDAFQGEVGGVGLTAKEVICR